MNMKQEAMGIRVQAEEALRAPGAALIPAGAKNLINCMANLMVKMAERVEALERAEKNK